MRKKILLICVALTCAILMTSCAADASASEAEHNVHTVTETDAAGEYCVESDGIPEAVTAYIVVHGFEWGPGVNRVVLELDEAVDAVCADVTSVVITSHWEREITAAYLSNRMGYAVEGVSKYVTFDLATSFDCTGSPFENDLEDTEHNVWADDYIVTVRVTVEKNGEHFPVMLQEDCIGNHFSPDVVAFGMKGTYSGEYFNVLRGKTETLALNWAAYEPASALGSEKNPLIVWLHGRGEGGDDIEIALLGNEVSALTESQIQSHFTADSETGAYVLVPQTPTYWMDAGDGQEHGGDMDSCYQQILMDLIRAFIAENPDVDPDRVYLIGASNGGYMALEMVEHYPDTFAAAVLCSPAYSYGVYAREADGSYRKFFTQNIPTGDRFLTEEKIEAMKHTPIWIVSSASDTIIPVLDYTVPLYHALAAAGADNCWCSMYTGVVGTESTRTLYLGHWAWIYLLNDQVSFVQDPARVAESGEDTFFYGIEPGLVGGSIRVQDGTGGEYTSVFDWLNDQSL